MPTPEARTKRSRALVEQPKRSKIYRDYETAFRETTGLTFTACVARLRMEKVKYILLNPHKRIIEVAGERGVQSLSPFNQVLRRVTSQGPTGWRAKLPAPGNLVEARAVSSAHHSPC